MLTRRALLGAFAIAGPCAVMGTPAHAQLPEKLEFGLPDRLRDTARSAPIAIPSDVRFVAQSIDGQDVSAGEASFTVKADPVTGGQMLTGSTGCNGYRASIIGTGDGRIQIGGILSTKRGCPGDRGDLEDAFVKALRGATRMVAEGDRVILDGSGGRIAFTRAR
jgi:heat shock protein HslJ